jgi:hypothetical protein
VSSLAAAQDRFLNVRLVLVRLRMPDSNVVDLAELAPVIASVKSLAIRYREMTGRPLGITGEVAEYEAARLLGLQLAPVRQPGYDAVRPNGARLQIKARCLGNDAKRSQRVGSIKLDKDWDAVLLVILDSCFEPVAIYEAPRAAVDAALRAPGSRARNERGALAVSKFKAISALVWPPGSGARR